MTLPPLPDPDLGTIITKALRRAYHLGQTYWQQADSESYSQNKKADETERRYIALIADTVAYATAAVQAEREACAKVCDTLISEWPTDTKDAYDAGRLTALRNVADAIRARKD